MIALAEARHRRPLRVTQWATVATLPIFMAVITAGWFAGLYAGVWAVTACLLAAVWTRIGVS